jgi:hypothetical protein
MISPMEKGAISKFLLERRSKRYQDCSLEILNGIKSNWRPRSLHLRRNVSRRGASGWGGMVFGGEEEGGGVRSGPGAARTILLF